MSDARPGIFTIAIGANVDLARIIGALWAPAAMALSLFVATHFIALLCAKASAESYLGKMLIKETIELAGLALTAPFLVSACRLILLGEANQNYQFSVEWRRMRFFVTWLMLVGLAASTPMLIAILDRAMQPGIVYYAGPRVPDPPGAVSGQMIFILAVMVFMAVSRLMILLPAIAIDAEGASVRNLFADTRLRVHYAAAAMFVAMVPLMLAMGLIAAITQALRLNAAWPILYLVFVIGIFLALTLSTAVSSRVYHALGDRLNQAVR